MKAVKPVRIGNSHRLDVILRENQAMTVTFCILM